MKKISDTGIQEIYGTTEGSAIPFEAISASKPLIIPQDFQIIKELKTSTLQYKSKEDLEKIVIEVIENKEKLKKLKKEAMKNSQQFSLDKIQKYFSTEILEKIDDL